MRCQLGAQCGAGAPASGGLAVGDGARLLITLTQLSRDAGRAHGLCWRQTRWRRARSRGRSNVGRGTAAFSRSGTPRDAGVASGCQLGTAAPRRRSASRRSTINRAISPLHAHAAASRRWAPRGPCRSARRAPAARSASGAVWPSAAATAPPRRTRSCASSVAARRPLRPRAWRPVQVMTRRSNDVGVGTARAQGNEPGVEFGAQRIELALCGGDERGMGGRHQEMGPDEL